MIRCDVFIGATPVSLGEHAVISAFRARECPTTFSTGNCIYITKSCIGIIFYSFVYTGHAPTLYSEPGKYSPRQQ